MCKKMKTLFNFSTIALLLLTLIGLTLFFAIGHGVYSEKGASLRFVNASGQTVTSAQIAVSGRFCSVKRLGAGGEIECYFENLSDSSYSVAVTLQDGAVYSANGLGYVTGGMNFDDTITINEAGEIKLDSKASA